MPSISVPLKDRSYRILVGRGLVGRLAELLRPLVRGRVVFVTSPKVCHVVSERVLPAAEALDAPLPVLVPDGERSKTAATLARLYDGFLDARLRRDGLVVAVGGGVVGDLAGYAAATWMRGVDWVVIPTTLLSMVDSSIGGKTGHNHPRAKNMIGAFHQPRLVVADVDLLGTLPLRQLRTGAYEALKTGFLGDRSLVELFEQAPVGLRGWDPQALEQVVTRAATVKADVVSRDEREGDLRRILNLGHTVGHALESVTAYRRFTHGEAVGWGMIAAAAIARQRGLISERLAGRIRTAVDRIGPRPRVDDLDEDAIVSALWHDKKVKADRLVFVLPKALDHVVVKNDVAEAEVRGVLRSWR